MRFATAYFLVTAVLVSLPWCQEDHNHALTEEEVGSVHFATSCKPEISSSFNRAVALLHSFQYEQARQVFTGISAQDPQCAMAQWGVAMSHYHGLWDNGSFASGQEAILKARKIATVNSQTTPRETAYIDALSEIYRADGKDKVAQAQAF